MEKKSERFDLRKLKERIIGWSKLPAFWICAVGLIALTTFFIVWLVNNLNYSVWAKLCAFLSAAAYAVVCVIFVPRWMEFWTPSKPTVQKRARFRYKQEVKEDAPKHIELKIFASLLIFCGATLVLVHLLRSCYGYKTTFVEGLEYWRRLDSNHYLQIAEDWYLSEGDWDRLVQLVFLPGYPIAIKLVNVLIGNYLYSGFIVSALSFAGAGCVTYKLLRLDYSHADALRALKFVCVIPGAFFYASPMSESLFLLLCVSCIYLIRKEKWVLGGLIGGYASFTRSLGLALCVPVFVELVAQVVKAWKEKSASERAKFIALRVGSFLIILSGFVAYLVINYLVSGDFLKFMEYQSVHWHQNLGWFFNTSAYQLDYAINTFVSNQENFFALWLPSLTAQFFSLGLMISTAKKLRPSYTGWFLAYYLIAIGATWLLSAPRYLLVLLPIPLAASEVSKKPVVNVILTALGLALGFAYLRAFVLGWQVW